MRSMTDLTIRLLRRNYRISSDLGGIRWMLWDSLRQAIRFESVRTAQNVDALILLDIGRFPIGILSYLESMESYWMPLS